MREIQRDESLVLRVQIILDENDISLLKRQTVTVFRNLLVSHIYKLYMFRCTIYSD